MSQKSLVERSLQLNDVNPLEFFGVNDEKINLIKQAYPSVKFVARGNELKTLGEPEKLLALQGIFESILNEIRQYGEVDNLRIRQILETKSFEGPGPSARNGEDLPDDVILKGHDGKLVRARTHGQRQIVEAANTCDLVFATGPAGSGKTYTAVAVAVKALRDRKVRKIILVRPAVEAGEHLGFLPGDLKDKIDPYLRPLYDGLEDMIAPERLKELIEKKVIEIAPLAYMRGRTLGGAFIILDEGQNATRTQMKMFLTRLGEESKIIVTGDVTQIDLPRKQDSGLIHAIKLLEGTPGIGSIRLNESDVVRHPLVRQVLRAYEADEEKRLALLESPPGQATSTPEAQS